MKYIPLALLAVFTVWHLVDSWKDDTQKRRRTKPFLLLLILIYYLVSGCRFSLFLVGALLTSWLGDVLLMPHGNKWFISGGISFLFSHFLFIGVYVSNIDFSSLVWKNVLPAVIPLAAVYFGTAAVILKLLTPTTPKMMCVPMYLYLLANSSMNIFAFIQMLNRPCAGSVVAYIGAVLFFISDCTLYLVRYYKKPEVVFKKHFTVMLTYVLGEFLITQGVMMLIK